MRKAITLFLFALILASCSTPASTTDMIQTYNKTIDKTRAPINEENFKEIEEDGFGKRQFIHHEQIGDLTVDISRRLEVDETTVTGYEVIIAGNGEMDPGLDTTSAIIKAMSLSAKKFEKELDGFLTSTERYEYYEDRDYHIIFTDFRDTGIFAIQMTKKIFHVP